MDGSSIFIAFNFIFKTNNIKLKNIKYGWVGGLVNGQTDWKTGGLKTEARKLC
jgi:hypothetical protein